MAMQAGGAVSWLPWAWLAGALALALVFAMRQWRFGRQLPACGLAVDVQRVHLAQAAEEALR